MNTPYFFDVPLTCAYFSLVSGTPKGVELTHEALVSAIAGHLQRLPKLRSNYDIYIGYLPLAHVLELTCEFCCLIMGVRVSALRLCLQISMYFNRRLDLLFQRYVCSLVSDSCLSLSLTVKHLSYSVGWQNMRIHLVSRSLIKLRVVLLHRFLHLTYLFTSRFHKSICILNISWPITNQGSK